MDSPEALLYTNNILSAAVSSSMDAANMEYIALYKDTLSSNPFGE